MSHTPAESIYRRIILPATAVAVLVCAVAANALNFSHFGTEDGLAHPAVLDITQDALGRIWFATEEGVSLYDGNRITTYKSYSDRDGRFLYTGDVVRRIGSTARAVFLQTDKAMVRYDLRSEEFDDIDAVAATGLFSRGDSVWYVAGNRLILWDDSKRKSAVLLQLPFQGTLFMLRDSRDRFFFGTENGLYTYADSKFSRIHNLPMVEALFEAADGSIWAGTKKSGLVHLLNDGSVRVYNTANSAGRGLRENDIRKIAQDRSGNLWFGSFSGLYKYNPETDSFESFHREERTGALSNSSVHSVFIDSNDMLWAGTYFGGVNFAFLGNNSSTFHGTSDRDNFLSSPVVGEMHEDKDGNIWLCTEGGGLNRLNPADGTITRFSAGSAPLPAKNLKSAVYDSEKECFYIGTTADGLYKYDIRSNKFTKIGNGTVNSIAREGDRLFISGDNALTMHSLSDGIETAICPYTGPGYRAIRIDSDKRLWLALDNELIAYGALSLKKLRSYSLADQGIANSITDVLKASDNFFYIATNGHGMFRLDPDTGIFTPFPAESSPLLSNFCYHIAETSDGHLIVSGNKGISVFTKSGEVTKTLLPGDGMPVRALTRDCGLLVASDGTVYVGGTNGLASFNGPALLATEAPATLYFTELHVNGSRIAAGGDDGILSAAIPYTDEISLASDQNRISLFFAPHSSQPTLSQTIYEYKLEGFDKTWYQTLNKSISYTNLEPGGYTLRVRAKSFSPEADAPVTSLKINVRQPWYFTWWACLLWIAVLFAAAAVAVRFTVMRRRYQTSLLKEQMENAKIREVNEAKFRFFTNVSHEFRTPLTLIIGQLDLLMQSSSLPPSLYNKLAKVVRQTQHLNNLVTELIEFRKYEQNRRNIRVAEYSLNSYVNSEYDSFRELALLQKIDYTFTPCPEDVKVWIDARQMRKVMYNLLANAFKYTAKGGKIDISVSADTAKGEAYIKITDNGVGMDQKDLGHIFERFYQAGNVMPQSNFTIGSGIGLALTKSIIEAHKGSISASSRPGSGAVFTITLRLGKDHLCDDDYIIFDEAETLENDRRIIFTHDEEESAQTETPVPQEAGGTPEEKPSVLLVEDNAELLKILSDLFSPFYNVSTAADGCEAYEKIQQSKPDLIVSDIMMPRMTGTELCVRIKNNIELCHIPVVLLTALNMPEQTLEGLTRGADDYIPKPFNARILLARCNNIIRARRLINQQLSHTADQDISLAATNSLDKKFLDTISAYIDENIADTNLSVSMIADRMCMGRTSFYNKFKALTGMSPNDFINSSRLKKAASMLARRKDLSVSEIADCLGFNTSSYFCRKFKEKYGVSPSYFRQHGGNAAAKDSQDEQAEEMS